MSTSEDFGELDDIGFLREADLFQDMPEAVIRTIVTQGHAVHFSTGEIIVKKGDPGDSLFVIKSGVVEVSQSRRRSAARLSRPWGSFRGARPAHELRADRGYPGAAAGGASRH